MGTDRLDRVDLVLPVYNEARVLAGSVERVAEAMADRRDCDWRIVVADNGSTDGTAALARQLAEASPSVRLVALRTKGRGYALRNVWNETDADYSIYMDVDLSTDLEAIPRMLELLRQGADVVAGSRLAPDARVARCVKREVLSRGYNRLVRWVLRTRAFDDAQCGFKGVRVRAIRPLLPLVENNDWFFDTELLTLAEYAGLCVRQVPVRWIEDRDSKVHIGKTVWQDVKGLWRLWRRGVGGRDWGLGVRDQGASREGEAPAEPQGSFQCSVFSVQSGKGDENEDRLKAELQHEDRLKAELRTQNGSAGASRPGVGDQGSGVREENEDRLKPGLRT